MIAPAPLPEFSDAALARLSAALRGYVSSWDVERHEELRVALERLCREAHAGNLGPERMLVAVKAAWARVPGIATLDEDRLKVAFSRVVENCIEAYYGLRLSQKE